ncbi:MAG: terminase large subunit [Solirubrobacterales bacterium]
MPWRNTYRGFLAFTRALGVELETFQRKIARAAFGAEREVAAILPRGNAKTTLAALLGLHHLVSVPDASVSLGAASREQAAIAFSIMREFAEHPAIRDLLVVRHLALRAEEGGVLRVVSGHGERAHGQTDSLMIGDEVWSWRDDKLLEAFQTAMVKRADARLVLISTPAGQLDSPLGNLRKRAMSGLVEERGYLVDATAPGLRWLEWGVPDGVELTPARVARANPASWLTTERLSEQQHRVTPAAWAQFHAGRWGVGEAAWLPPGAWGACRELYEVEEGEPVWAAADVGGRRAASALVAVTADLRVASVQTWQGDESVMELPPAIRDLADRFQIQECAFDPWRFKSEAMRLEAEGVGPMVEFPQSASRMIPASERLHAAIVERRLRHRGFPELDRAVASAVARQVPGGRGWRLDKSDLAAMIDAAICLAMAVERAEFRPAPVKLIGWA